MGLPWWVARKGLSEEVVGRIAAPQGGIWVAFGRLEIVVTAILFLLCPNGSSCIRTPLICSLAREGFDHGLEVRVRFILGGFGVCLGLYLLLRF